MDIVKSIFKYKNKEIIVLIHNNKPWFNAKHVCNILNIKYGKNAIKSQLKKKYYKYLKDIFDDYKIYPNAQPKSFFINESGLYSLVIRSRKKEAQYFFDWIIEEVLPSIRETGMYVADKKTKKEIDELNKIIDQKDAELKEKSLRVLSLENNQKNKHLCSKGKYIYVLKSSLNDYIDEDKPDTLRIGKTTKYKIRLNTYNSGLKDNTIVLYRAKTNDISAVENCLKGLLSKKVYRSYREYYNITLREAIRTIKKCIKLTGSKLISEDKFYHKYKLSKSSRLNGFNYGLSNNECQTNQTEQTEQTDQKGGTYSDPYHNEQTIKSYTYYAGLYEAFNNLMNIMNV